jgi:hypothetical protein
MSASTKQRSPRFPVSGKTTLPSLGQMIRDARADQQVIRRATQQALRAWFRQSERLHIARRKYRLRGPRFVHLVHLHRYRAQIISRCVDDAADAAKRGQAYHYPGWETALGWFHPIGGRSGGRRGRYWLTPPTLYRKLDAEFQFDYDPCPYRLPKGFNALLADWGKRNWVNPPFNKDDVIGGKGATAFVRKAIEEQKKGKTSVIVLPVFDYVTMLLEAGAEVRPLGRVPFLDVERGRTAPQPPNIACFILRPVKPWPSNAGR